MKVRSDTGKSIVKDNGYLKKALVTATLAFMIWQFNVTNENVYYFMQTIRAD